MKVINNTAETPIEVGFEGYIYFIPSGQKRLVEEKVGEFLLERYPFLELVEPPNKRGGPTPIPKIDRKQIQIKAKIDNSDDMQIMSNKAQNATSPADISNGIDADGVEWVGPGIEVEKIDSKGVFT